MHLREVEMNSELKHTLVKCTQNVLPNVSLSIERIHTLIQDIENELKNRTWDRNLFSLH